MLLIHHFLPFYEKTSNHFYLNPVSLCQNSFIDIMKKLPFLWGIIILLLSVAGCRPSNHRALLQHVDSLIAYYPDSVLSLLAQQQEHLADFSEEELMNYVWMKAMIHKARNISMTEDTLLPKAVDYFRKYGDREKVMRGYLLKAHYLKWMDRLDDAIAVLDSGVARAKLDKDSVHVRNLLYCKAGIIYELRRDYREVACYMKEALACSPDTTSSYVAEMVYFLAINLSLIGDDSCTYYYEKSIAMAEANKDTAYLCHYMRNYASSLMRSDEVEKSNALIRRVWELMPVYREKMAITHAILAENFLNLRQLDSAVYYLNMAWQTEAKAEQQFGVNISTRLLLYELQNVADYALGGNISTIRAGRFGDSLILADFNKQSTIQQQMDTKIKLDRQNYTLIIDRQRTQLLLLTFLFAFLASGLCVFFYVRNRRFRLAEAEDRIETLTRLLEDANKANESEGDNAFFKKILLKQLGIIRLVATTPTAQNQDMLRRISGITNKEVPVETLLVWEDLYPVIDKIYGGFYSRMEACYGHLLSEKEKQICCLLCADFSTKEIGVVTQQSVASVYVRKTTIRKKLGMDEKGDIVAYIKNMQAV